MAHGSEKDGQTETIQLRLTQVLVCRACPLPMERDFRHHRPILIQQNFQHRLADSWCVLFQGLEECGDLIGDQGKAPLDIRDAAGDKIVHNRSEALGYAYQANQLEYQVLMPIPEAQSLAA